jgi:hypothetical protein
VSEELEEVLARLRREYVAASPIRLQEMRKDVAAFLAGESDAIKSLIVHFHHLGGSGVSHGYPQISEIARPMEGWLKSDPPPAPEQAARLDEAVKRLAESFDRAGVELAGKAPALPPSGFRWSALIFGEPGPVTNQLEEVLRSVGYRVVTSRVEQQPELAISDTPDMVIVVGGQANSDPYAIAAALSSR